MVCLPESNVDGLPGRIKQVPVMVQQHVWARGHPLRNRLSVLDFSTPGIEPHQRERSLVVRSRLICDDCLSFAQEEGRLPNVAAESQSPRELSIGKSQRTNLTGALVCSAHHHAQRLSEDNSMTPEKTDVMNAVSPPGRPE